jgi:acyl-CoA thioesterase-2
MPDVPAPESLPSAADVLADRDDEASRYWAGGRSIDHRHVPGPIYLAVEGEPLPHQAVWLRSFDALPDDENLHRAALAYACDYTILEPALRSLSTPWAQHGLVTASLDHSMWFHRFGRIDEWILYAQELDSLQSNRALNLGRFFTRSGVHLATVAQEGMIRRSTASAH